MSLTRPSAPGGIGLCGSAWNVPPGRFDSSRRPLTAGRSPSRKMSRFGSPTETADSKIILRDEQTARREIVRVGRLLYERSYVVSSDGNVSVRLDDGRIVATPTQVNKGRMTEEMLAVTDIEGKALNDRRASSELAMHLLVYREREDA